MPRRFALACLSMLLSAAAARAAVSPDEAAAVVNYPYVFVDAQSGHDTFLQLSNTANASTDVFCVYEDATGTCANSAQSCFDNVDCPDPGTPQSVCLPGFTIRDFTIRLTAGQPIGWLVSAGLASLPLAANTGSIPAVGSEFRGALRCVAVDAAGVPTETNVLEGVATIERLQTGIAPQIDVAKYNAVGIQAIAGAGNGDNVLVIGGDSAEYSGCPNITSFNHFFDGALDPLVVDGHIRPGLVLLPCSVDYANQIPAVVLVQYLVFNEFEQRLGTSKLFEVQQVGLLSAVNRAIYDINVQGTLTGQTRLLPLQSGVLALAFEQNDAAAGQGGTFTADFAVQQVGTRQQGDIIVLPSTP